MDWLSPRQAACWLRESVFSIEFLDFDKPRQNPCPPQMRMAQQVIAKTDRPLFYT